MLTIKEKRNMVNETWASYNEAFKIASKTILEIVGIFETSGVSPAFRDAITIFEEDYWAPERADFKLDRTYNYHTYTGLKRVDGDKDAVNLSTLNSACIALNGLLEQALDELDKLEVSVEIPATLRKLM
jgi:hypothetical protein